MKHVALWIVSALLLSASSAAFAQAPAADSPPIPKYLEVTPLLGTGGQPTDTGLRTLADKGYKAVVNLRTETEKVDLVAEEKLVRELGLKYYSVPLVGTAPDDRSAVEYLRVMDELKGEKVFVHCAAANRVGAVVMIQRVLRDGLTQDEAEEEAARIGLHTDVLRNFAREFIRKNGK
jgi:protein tyrosine phosphatase (PTP) superfamily phosphohydrolase (DUF442 family)